MPAEYAIYKDIASKSASDILHLSRPYNYKIELEGETELIISLLYKIILEEFEIIKQYLIDNLDKGFIKTNQSLYKAPVLFIRKLTGGLRFYIDYRKFNAFTRKDRYPLPLIDETLARLSKAKIFTKLDIH